MLPSLLERRGKVDKCSVPNIQLDYKWTKDTPLQARALVLAGNTLFVAGPPDVLDEPKVFILPGDPGHRPQLNKQEAALKGSMGGLLWVVSATDGGKLAEYQLQSMPVFDGMAAANQRLYLSCIDGAILCMAGK